MDVIVRQLQRHSPLLAIAGGLVWILYAIWALLQPLGAINLYTDALGQLQVTNLGAFRVAIVAGAGGLILLGLAAVGTASRHDLTAAGQPRFGAAVPSRFGAPMAWVGALAGAVALAAVLVPAVALASSSLLVGSVLVPFAVLLIAVTAVGSESAGALATPLFLVGVLGMVGVLAQAMLASFAWMLPVYAALAQAVYGFTWVRFGAHLYRLTP